MGKLLWHQWAQFVNIFASVYVVWAGFWGCLFPKFFWDFVRGSLLTKEMAKRACTDANPCGIVPSPQDAVFVNIIVKAPVIQVLAMVFGVTHLVIELVPVVQKTAIHRSLLLKVVTLLVQTFLAVLFYQGTNGAIYSFMAAIGYGVAIVKGEQKEFAKELAKQNRGGKEGGSSA
jgi:hypothetical protein